MAKYLKRTADELAWLASLGQGTAFNGEAAFPQKVVDQLIELGALVPVPGLASVQTIGEIDDAMIAMARGL